LSFVLPSPERNYSLKDQNQVNQHNEHYMALRAKANEEGDLMGQSFQGSHEAYSRGEGARAKELSEKGKQHERVMENLNAEASTWIFRGECNVSCARSCLNLRSLTQRTTWCVSTGAKKFFSHGISE
jgi:hypothetical protein